MVYTTSTYCSANSCLQEEARRASFKRRDNASRTLRYGMERCWIGPPSRQLLSVGRKAELSLRESRRRGVAHDKLRLDRDGGDVFFFFFDLIDEGLRGDFAHAHERLTDGGERGIRERRAWNVVEAHDGNVFRHAEAHFLQRPDGADGGDVVVREQ